MQILLVDDHAMFREGLVLLLAPLLAGRTPWQAGSFEEAEALIARDGPPELVLMDLGLPGMPGLQGIAALRARHPQVPVVAVSSDDARDTVLAAIDAGAMGFIPKSSNSAVLLAALNLVLARGVYLPPQTFLAGGPGPDAGHGAGPASAAPAAGLAPGVAPGVAPVAAMMPATPAPGALPAAAATPASALPAATGGPKPSSLGMTPRQADVLYLLLQGKPAKLIERELGLAASTVKSHTSAVLRALNVTTRTQAVVAAGRLGLRFDPPAR
jgi:DNA-binding NarL/FixJ family response regulator